jgi:ribonuclease HI
MHSKVAVIYVDGGSRGNPGPAGSGAVITVDGQLVAELSKYIGVATNNVAEYTGLIIGLEKAYQLGYKKVDVRMDSELVVKQMLGIYKVKNENLLPLSLQAQSLAKKFSHFKIEHVRREFNKEADRLANLAMDLKADTTSESVVSG